MPNPSHCTGDIHTPRDIRHAEPLSLECRRFVDAVRDNTPVITDGRDGERVVRVLTAGSISIQAGGAPVDVRSGHPIALA